MKLFFLLIIIFSIPSCELGIKNTNQENLVFKNLIGLENKPILDSLILNMESKFSTFYKKEFLEENYIAFLQDLIRDEKIIKYQNHDCLLVKKFELSELEDQFNILSYDTVFFEEGIVTKDQEGNISVEIAPSYIQESTEVKRRIDFLKKIGYGKISKKGKLRKALESNSMNNPFITSFYNTGYLTEIISTKDYAKTILNLSPDYNNFLVKSIIFYEVFLQDIKDKYCTKRFNENQIK